MLFETTLIYNEKLIRCAVWSYWKRTVGGLYPLVLLALTTYFFVLLFKGDKTWLVGLIGTLLGISYLLLAGIYAVHFKRSISKFREMGNLGSLNATFQTDDHSFTVNSAIGTSTLKWSTVKEIWRFQDVWLLLFSKAEFMTLPLINLPLDMQTFILEKVKSTGGKIK
jgi:hypothetical protein